MGAVIGLTGGVASGKSTVARRLARRGLRVLDADAEARRVVEQPAILSALAEAFGDEILDAQGALDRAALAQRAFASAEATMRLNAIVHPAVRRRLLAALDEAGERPVVLDVPLLLESPLADRVTLWVHVEANSSVRDERVRERDWTPGERERREARQAGLAAKRARADHVLENEGTIEDLERQVDALLLRIGVAPTST